MQTIGLLGCLSDKSVVVRVDLPDDEYNTSDLTPLETPLVLVCATEVAATAAYGSTGSAFAEESVPANIAVVDN